ncbi:response regulator [Chryseosolibacter indicus]|uniref:histidine kinase n=1 Tax=Chryseosolibacter indicus TaxID=2782351 RepID=A0ABS5VM01_9BACT|nr:response regulator [Chryseosolibacter indicus]MBT1702475.1 response regulator [Chryseosolibacter indicus]
MNKAGILIVEDSFIVAFHLKKTLENEGYKVIGTEASGERALQLIEQSKPDLVLMDIMLNGPLDGIETARVIKSKYNLPIIYITALSDKETVQRAKITEPFGYLTKPFEDREIFTVIEMALYKHEIELRLKQSEEKFFSTVRSISDAVIVMDDQYNVVYVNPSAEAITERSLKDLQSQNILHVLQFGDSLTNEYPVNPFQCVLGNKNRNSLPEHLILYSRNRVKKPVGEGSVSPVLNSKGKSLGVVLIFKDITEKLEHQKLLKEFEIKKLSALLQGQEQERSRIARDLHDGLGQMLNAIKMNVTLLGREDAKIDNLYKLIDEAIQESIRISDNLIPAKLKDFDLATCIESLCRQMEISAGFTVTFECLGVVEELPQEFKINYYRIAQEAINNAVKHADARTINVQLSEDDGIVQMMIEDDGKGIELSSDYDQSVHHGLINMRERAETMGGKLTIESDGKRGTLVIVETPINKKTSSNVEV